MILSHLTYLIDYSSFFSEPLNDGLELSVDDKSLVTHGSGHFGLFLGSFRRRLRRFGLFGRLGRDDGGRRRQVVDDSGSRRSG